MERSDSNAYLKELEEKDMNMCVNYVIKGCSKKWNKKNLLTTWENLGNRTYIISDPQTLKETVITPKKKNKCILETSSLVNKAQRQRSNIV